VRHCNLTIFIFLFTLNFSLSRGCRAWGTRASPPANRHGRMCAARSMAVAYAFSSLKPLALALVRAYTCRHLQIHRHPGPTSSTPSLHTQYLFPLRRDTPWAGENPQWPHTTTVSSTTAQLFREQVAWWIHPLFLLPSSSPPLPERFKLASSEAPAAPHTCRTCAASSRARRRSAPSPARETGRYRSPDRARTAATGSLLT